MHWTSWIHCAPAGKKPARQVLEAGTWGDESLWRSGFQAGDGFRGWFQAIFTPIPPYAKYFLITFTLISKMIKFDLSGADFSQWAEKLEPWEVYNQGLWLYLMLYRCTEYNGFTVLRQVGRRILMAGTWEDEKIRYHHTHGKDLGSLWLCYIRKKLFHMSAHFVVGGPT